jgi:hypothetical protein
VAPNFKKVAYSGWIIESEELAYSKLKVHCLRYVVKGRKVLVFQGSLLLSETQGIIVQSLSFPPPPMSLSEIFYI